VEYELARGGHDRKKKNSRLRYGEEELGEGTAVKGAVRSSGKPSPARRSREGEIAAAAVAQMEFLKWRMRGRRRKTPCTPIYSARW